MKKFLISDVVMSGGVIANRHSTFRLSWFKGDEAICFINSNLLPFVAKIALPLAIFK